MFVCLFSLIYYPARTCASGGYVIGADVCIYIYLCVTNATLAVDSPFQTLTVDFSSNL